MILDLGYTARRVVYSSSKQAAGCRQLILLYNTRTYLNNYNIEIKAAIHSVLNVICVRISHSNSLLREFTEAPSFPPREFFRANGESSNLIGWRQTLTSSPTNHSLFKSTSYPGSLNLRVSGDRKTLGTRLLLNEFLLL